MIVMRPIDELKKLELIKVVSFEERVAHVEKAFDFITKPGATILIATMVSIEAWGLKPVFRAVRYEDPEFSGHVERIELHIDGEIDSDINDEVQYFANLIRHILTVK